MVKFELTNPSSFVLITFRTRASVVNRPNRSIIKETYSCPAIVINSIAQVKRTGKTSEREKAKLQSIFKTLYIYIYIYIYASVYLIISISLYL
uniref:Uncharacterized protein n=1 Tax=Octopus bimaculoides TaxID=37653 RepID=A0A0L8I4X4_OCTBM